MDIIYLGRVTSQEDDLITVVHPSAKMTDTLYPVDSDESNQSSPTTPTGQPSTPVSVTLAHDRDVGGSRTPKFRSHILEG